MKPEAGSRKAEGESGVAVLVSSCDRFFDAWRPFGAFWRRHWPGADLPWPAFLVTNRLVIRSDWLTPLPVGADRGWSDNLRGALGRLDADYLLYLQEDYFLTAPPDAARLAALLARCRADAVDLLCLRAMPPGHGAEAWPRVPPVPNGGGTLSEVPADTPWRGRLQAAFWRREALRDALRPGESAWDFEAHARERLAGLRAWTVTGEGGDPALPYLSSAIVRGLWTPEARHLCAAAGVAIAPDCRGTVSPDPRVCKLRRALDRVRLPLTRWRQGRAGAVEV